MEVGYSEQNRTEVEHRYQIYFVGSVFKVEDDG